MLLETHEVESIERGRRLAARRRRVLWACGVLAALCLLELTTCWGRLTLLHGAAVVGSPDLARAALRAGADPNRRPPLTLPFFDTRPLYPAAGGGHATVVRVLLDAGADAEPPRAFPVSPLRRAAQGGHEDICRMLVEAGADVTNWEPDEAPLAAAIRARDSESVACLLDAGAADDSACAGYAEQVAEELGEYQIAEMIREYAPTDEDGTP